MSGILFFSNNKPAVDESVEFFAETEKAKPQEKYEKAAARATTDEKGQFSIKILKGQKGELPGSMLSFIGEYENCPKLDKIIRAKGNSVQDIKTPVLEVEANNDLSGIQLKFPFPSCKKSKID